LKPNDKFFEIHISDRPWVAEKVNYTLKTKGP